MPAKIENHLPQYLYRYRPLGKKLNREVDALVQGYIYCGSYRSLNDPMEGLYAANHGDGFVDDIYDAKGGTGIASFSETPDNELMWAHYADQSRGMCVEYDFAALRQSMEGGYFSRMHYSDDAPAIDFADSMNFGRTARSILRTKRYPWTYEREWRYFRQGVGKAWYQLGLIDLPVRRVILGSAGFGDQFRLRRLLPSSIGLHTTDIEGYRIRISDERDDRVRLAPVRRSAPGRGRRPA